MIAYKFLADGAVGPFTRFAWPRPDPGGPAWVSAPEGASDERWIHACRIEDLPYWLGAELWQVELADPVLEAVHQIASPRGRLVAQVTGWTRATAAEFGRACAFRARELALPRLAPAARDVLAGAQDVGELAAASARLVPDVGAPAAYLNTAAICADEAPAVSAFAVETFARDLAGDAAGLEERRRQAAWLRERLALDDV
jgi:hypothetical protein